MDSAYVYLPDDEPDSQQYNGHAFVLKPNATTEIVPHDAVLAKDEAWLREFEGPASAPTGKVMVRWSGVEPATVADHIVTHQKRWGVVRTHGPVEGGVPSDPGDTDTVAAAERQYLIGTKEWAEQMVMDDYRRNDPRVAAGLPAIESDDAKKAKAWLVDKGEALRAAGLL